MPKLKSLLLPAVAITISCALFGQQAKLIDSLNQRNEKLKLVLNDSDHDGITDQLDKEANTPAGCPVDTHGVTLDTDEDGVPDCKDKEKLTLKKCFPVDSNGVGTCPEQGYGHIIADPLFCHIYSFPYVQFKNDNQTLNKEQMKVLDSVVFALMNYPYCTAILQGYYNSAIKLSEQVTTARLKNIMRYLTENGEKISESRLIANAVEGKCINTIDIIPGTR